MRWCGVYPIHGMLETILFSICEDDEHVFEVSLVDGHQNPSASR